MTVVIMKMKTERLNHQEKQFYVHLVTGQYILKVTPKCTIDLTRSCTKKMLNLV